MIDQSMRVWASRAGEVTCLVRSIDSSKFQIWHITGALTCYNAEQCNRKCSTVSSSSLQFGHHCAYGILVEAASVYLEDVSAGE
ncbi:hypothetical protein DPMN_087654 [Dreissena polymorpha]|uniref:Uncharacterized protein n=1 Tax=Dreissena polymorpha TaxID=45954 RepID=A0A9D4KTK1_DREPO|nr:hypothetical protein DPMN_087654 [Dreissena polymorpha]